MQQVQRAHMAKKETQARRSEKAAATKVQAIRRGYLERKAVDVKRTERHAIINLQSKTRQAQARKVVGVKREQTKRAVVMQSAARRKIAVNERKKIVRQEASAVYVQAAARRRTAVREAERRRKHELHKVRCASRIQQLYRRKVALQMFRMAVFLRYREWATTESAQAQASIKVQAAARGHKGRRVAKRMWERRERKRVRRAEFEAMEEWEQEIVVAKRFQAAYRGALIRREFRVLQARRRAEYAEWSALRSGLQNVITASLVANGTIGVGMEGAPGAAEAEGGAGAPPDAEFVEAAIQSALAATSSMWRLSQPTDALAQPAGRYIRGFDVRPANLGLFGLPPPPPPSYMASLATRETPQPAPQPPVAPPPAVDDDQATFDPEGTGARAQAAKDQGSREQAAADAVASAEAGLGPLAVGGPLLLAMPAAMQASAAELAARQDGALSHSVSLPALGRSAVGGHPSPPRRPRDLQKERAAMAAAAAATVEAEAMMGRMARQRAPAHKKPMTLSGLGAGLSAQMSRSSSNLDVRRQMPETPEVMRPPIGVVAVANAQVRIPMLSDIDRPKYPSTLNLNRSGTTSTASMHQLSRVQSVTAASASKAKASKVSPPGKEKPVWGGGPGVRKKVPAPTAPALVRSAAPAALEAVDERDAVYESLPGSRGTGNGTGSTGATAAIGMGADDDEEGMELAREKAIASLASRVTVGVLRRALASHVGRVMRLFEEWDEDGDGTVSKAEFRLAIKSLSGIWGLDVSRVDVENLFDSLDIDGSGVIDYAELKEMVRVERIAMAKAKAESRSYALAKQPSAAREVKTFAPIPLPNGGTLLEALRAALVRANKTPQDLTDEWDDDHSGTVTRDEFALALARLGLGPPSVDESLTQTLFDQFDEDGSGFCSSAELQKGLRRALEQTAPPVTDDDWDEPNPKTGLFPNGSKLRVALRSKSAALPALDELDAEIHKITDKVGARAPQWSDPNDGLSPERTYAGRQPRAAAIDLGKLRSQLRGHDLGLDAQVPPMVTHYTAGVGAAADSPLFTKRAAANRPMGLAQKMRTLTSSVYGTEPNGGVHSRPRLNATQSAVSLGGGKQARMMRASESSHSIQGAAGGPRGGLPMSRSLPEGALLPEGIDGPTVGGYGGGGYGGAADDATAEDEDTGPAPPSGLRGIVPRERRRAAKSRVPWKNDKRCDPLARFYEPPNVDHLLMAEEV